MGAHSAILRIKQRSLVQGGAVGCGREGGCALWMRINQFCVLHSALSVLAQHVGLAEREVAHYGCALINIAHYTAFSRSRRSRWV